MDIIFCVPQGFALGPLLFNIHLCDLFHFLENFDIASYADHTTIYTTERNKDHFKDLLICCKDPSSTLIEGSCIKLSQKELPLGATIVTMIVS